MSRYSTISIFISILLLCSCQRDRYLVINGYAQGGTYTVKANLKGTRVSRKGMAAEIERLLVGIDTTLSGYNKSSQLSRFNRGEDFEPGPMFRELLDISEKYRETTDGAFDVWAAPLFDIWGFGFRTDSLPDNERIKEAMALTREHKRLNFNAIAQGYSCDVIARYLHSIGVKDMLVDIGEIYCEGVNPKGRGWSIGIDTPFDGNNTPGASLSGIWESDGGAHGVVTSGNYRKFYIKDGKKYAHTIDPRTGRPVDHDLLSATVVAPTATEADALATYFMVAGFEEARKYIEAHPGIEACLICSDSTWCSRNF
ncbi:MAG: FAD:protein FMN transferase [Bacteroidales bacterium]|nr:FAD:protein FMN transferase [Bacteroidales bacterium]